MAKTFFKWPGSKVWLIKRLKGLFDGVACRAVEPFAGSSAFYLGGDFSEGLLGDTNKYVVVCLNAVRDQPKEVLKCLSRLKNCKEDYFLIRDQVPINEAHAAARLIFLTNTSWGGLYRENLSGNFNVPFGNNGREFYSEESIVAASQRLGSAIVRNIDFSETISAVKPADLIFVDPPYVTKTQSEFFDRYLSTRFSWSDQVRLAKLLTAKRLRMNKILVTCPADVDLYSLFPGWRVFEIDRRNSMTAHVGGARYRREALLASPSLDVDFSFVEGCEERSAI